MAVTNDELKRLRVAVLCGGASTEREVSLESGANVAKALADAGCTVRKVVIDDDSLSALDKVPCDICFNILHGGWGEDGGIQAALDAKGIPYTGSGSAACCYAMDKVHTKLMVEGEGVPVPEYISLVSVRKCREMVEDAGMQPPLVVKPVRQGSSVAVTMVDDWKDLPAAIEAALAVDETALIEERIIGTEVTVGILGDATLPIIQMRMKSDFLDYTAKYTDGLNEAICPAQIPDETARLVSQHALTAFRTIGGEHLCRADFMLDKDNNPYLLELNMLPGMTSHSFVPLAARTIGIQFPDLCMDILRLGWQRHLDRRGKKA